MELSIVVPIYNESDNIGPLLAEITAAMSGVDYEILMIDDASTDDSISILGACQGEYPQLRVIRHLSNSGQSTAVATGVTFARGTWVATLDGDGQNDPADIPRLLAEREPGDLNTLVAGIREKRNDSWLKRWSSRIANSIRGWLLGDGFPDTGCGLKLFPRELFIQLPKFDHMHRFLPALVRRQNGNVIGVAVNHRARQHGSSKYGLFNRLWVGIVDMFGVIWLQHRQCESASEELLS